MGRRSANSLVKRLKDSDFCFLDVGWSKFPITFHSNLKSEDGQKCDGLCEWSPTEIKIEEKQTEFGVREAIIHEIFHVITATVGLDYASEGDDDRVLEVKNEDLVTRISRGFILAQQLNIELFEVLMEKYK